MNTDTLPPHDLESEQTVLSCLLADHANAAPDLRVLLPEGEESFYDLKHRLIYRTLIAMKDGEGNAISLLGTLKMAGTLDKVGGREFISKLTESNAVPGTMEYAAAVVRERHVARKAIQVLSRASESLIGGKDDPLRTIDQVEQALARIRENADPETPAYGPVQLADKLRDYLEWRFNLQGKRSGFETGFYNFDRLTDGLQKGEQTIIAARPSIGKTAIALNIVEKVCFGQGIPTLFMSLEMSAEALTRRLLSGMKGIPMNSLKSGTFTEPDFKGFTAFLVQLKHSQLYIVDAVSGMSGNQVKSAIKWMHRKHGVQLVVVDYLQKIKANEKHEKRTYEVAEISGMLKGLAVSTGAAFLTLAQLNREPDKDKRQRPPRISDLADSGQIERDADTIGLLHRNDHEANLAIAKQRDGETGLVQLYFDGEHCRFENPRGNEGNDN